ncbi:hypothetical protein P4O66_016093 [Electrophorus voltai]|uniref:Active breakpoint cluster region-related protein n=1 Tax=Electrophorus voltai TaxID=2609070 RepID=A0AAD9DNS0_9TELE|nr:hypothetical protein P4O66_016093 [Electrophorus voltai]
MWEQEEFAKHWRNEFPDGDVPRMNLNSVEDIERELEKCKASMKLLQRALSEEKFKVIYLQTTIAQKKKSYDTERWGGKEGNQPEADVAAPKPDSAEPPSAHERFVRESTRVPTRIKLHGIGSKGSEDLISVAPNPRDLTRGSKTGKPILAPPPKKPGAAQESSAGPGLPRLDGGGGDHRVARREGAKEQDTAEHDSDREYEDVELNESFVQRNLLNPRAAVRENRKVSLGRDAFRPLRGSRDLDFGDDGRLSPYTAYRSSVGSGRSTPDRRSDGYPSSDHEDSSSAGRKGAFSGQESPAHVARFDAGDAIEMPATVCGAQSRHTRREETENRRMSDCTQIGSCRAAQGFPTAALTVAIDRHTPELDWESRETHYLICAEIMPRDSYLIYKLSQVTRLGVGRNENARDIFTSEGATSLPSWALMFGVILAVLTPTCSLLFSGSVFMYIQADISKQKPSMTGAARRFKSFKRVRVGEFLHHSKEALNHRLSVAPGMVSDFNYNTDGYEGDGAEDRKSQDGSETMPFIDESPTMSPQLCVRPDGEAVSPTPPDCLLPGDATSTEQWTPGSPWAEAWDRRHRKAEELGGAGSMEEEQEEVLGLLDKVLEDEDVSEYEGDPDLESPFTPGVSPRGLFKVDMEKGLEMKKLVLSGFLASEEIYINQLEALLLPMRPLKATATTSKPVLTMEQIETIFYKIQDIYEIHKEFYDALFPSIQQWNDRVTVGHFFKKLWISTEPFGVLALAPCHRWSAECLECSLASQLGVYKAFVDNYKVALETAEKCSQANSQFQKISENVKVKGPKDSKDCTTTVTMEALLYKPIDRVTRSTLVLHDLLKHTPKEHPDFALLEDALRISQNFLSIINEEFDPRRTAVTTPKGEVRQLVKDGFLVEMSEGSRKLRHVFLFTDLLLCAKMKKTAVGRNQQYECKWYIPLADLAFQALDDSDSCPPVQTLPEHEIEEMKIKISVIKSEIQKEKKAQKGQSRIVDRLRKKMNEQESCLLLNSPTIPFRIHNRHGKSYLFLLSSDYERCEWRESIQKLQKKDLQSCELSTVELQVLTSSCFKLRTVHNIPVTTNKDDEEPSGLYGFLHVIVHSATGFKESASKSLLHAGGGLVRLLREQSQDPRVPRHHRATLERGKPDPLPHSTTLNQSGGAEFEIELEGSQCLRILCYEKCYDKSKLNKDDNEIVDKIMGKGQVQGFLVEVQCVFFMEEVRSVVFMEEVRCVFFMVEVRCVFFMVEVRCVLFMVEVRCVLFMVEVQCALHGGGAVCAPHGGAWHTKGMSTVSETRKLELASPSSRAKQGENNNTLFPERGIPYHDGLARPGTFYLECLDPQAVQSKNWHVDVIEMSGIKVEFSMKFTSRDLSLKRTPSKKQSGVFGVKISVVTKRERSKVPYIVRQCIEEVEKRGIDEVGIYRISGVATDIQALKAAFDTNTKDILVMLSDMDINAIAGTLKLYFRELPEPLLTDRLYPAFMEGISLSDPAAKENCMMHLLRSLPDPNLITFLTLLEHLKRVAEKEPVNKMSLHNLATVFGPTLLRPSEAESNKPHVTLASDIWSHDVMAQVQVLLYYLQHSPISFAELKRNTLYFSTDV